MSSLAVENLATRLDRAGETVHIGATSRQVVYEAERVILA
jgi:adenylosuccinate lyase